MDKDILVELYISEQKSAKEIARRLGCSENKINYWIKKHGIPKRSISEAVYISYNPNGDPFLFKEVKTIDQAFLYGLGLGLYWGEGTKADKSSVRLGNTDPELINKFIEFLKEIFAIKKKDLRFGLQIFSDAKPSKALDFWSKKLNISKSQFYKVVITKSGRIGTYRKKNPNGVLTVYYHNKKLRDLLISKLPL